MVSLTRMQRPTPLVRVLQGTVIPRAAAVAAFARPYSNRLRDAQRAMSPLGTRSWVDARWCDPRFECGRLIRTATEVRALPGACSRIDAPHVGLPSWVQRVVQDPMALMDVRSILGPDLGIAASTLFVHRGGPRGRLPEHQGLSPRGVTLDVEQAVRAVYVLAGTDIVHVAPHSHGVGVLRHEWVEAGPLGPWPRIADEHTWSWERPSCGPGSLVMCDLRAPHFLSGTRPWAALVVTIVTPEGVRDLTADADRIERLCGTWTWWNNPRRHARGHRTRRPTR